MCCVQKISSRREKTKASEKTNIPKGEPDILSPWRTHEPLETYKDRLSFSTPEHGDLFYMIMDLPRKYRVAIYLYYYEEYSTEEIAQLLHIPKATVDTHLYRGRELLRKKINGGE